MINNARKNIRQFRIIKVLISNSHIFKGGIKQPPSSRPNKYKHYSTLKYRYLDTIDVFYLSYSKYSGKSFTSLVTSIELSMFFINPLNNYATNYRIALWRSLIRLMAFITNEDGIEQLITSVYWLCLWTTITEKVFFTIKYMFLLNCMHLYYIYNK